MTHPLPGSEDLAATWSFDGTRIAFSRSENGRGDLWLLPAEQGEPRLLLRDEHDNASPAWSVDGRRIAFSSDRAGSSGLWEIEVASGRLQQLIPDVSQTGEGPKLVIGSHGKLAYTESSHEVDLYWLEVATGTGRRLTSHTGEDMHARVSPDGRKLAYHSNRTGNHEVWLLDLATGEELALTDHPASDSLPDWSSRRSGDPLPLGSGGGLTALGHEPGGWGLASAVRANDFGTPQRRISKVVARRSADWLSRPHRPRTGALGDGQKRHQRPSAFVRCDPLRVVSRQSTRRVLTKRRERTRPARSRPRVRNRDALAERSAHRAPGLPLLAMP